MQDTRSHEDTIGRGALLPTVPTGGCWAVEGTCPEGPRSSYTLYPTPLGMSPGL